MKYIKLFNENVEYDQWELEQVLNIARDEGYAVKDEYSTHQFHLTGGMKSSRWYSFVVGGRLWKISIEMSNLTAENLYDKDPKFLPMILDIYQRLLLVLEPEDIEVRLWGFENERSVNKYIETIDDIKESIENDEHMISFIMRFKL